LFNCGPESKKVLFGLALRQVEAEKA
jgi:hypothetical protein